MDYSTVKFVKNSEEGSGKSRPLSATWSSVMIVVNLNNSLPVIILHDINKCKYDKKKKDFANCRTTQVGDDAIKRYF